MQRAKRCEGYRVLAVARGWRLSIHFGTASAVRKVAMRGRRGRAARGRYNLGTDTLADIVASPERHINRHGHQP